MQAKAFGELGRIIKTLYLLSYIDDETYRRRILTISVNYTLILARQYLDAFALGGRVRFYI